MRQGQCWVGEGGIVGKQAEWAQRPCSRNASGELEGQEEALVEDTDNGKVDEVVKPDLAGFVIRCDLKHSSAYCVEGVRRGLKQERRITGTCW